MKRIKNGVAPVDINLSPQQLLQKYWGYTEFRDKQREIIDSVLNGVDTLALMPTGGGKSITYQIPALMREGVCIVVSPIIALMKDQVDGLRRRGISAVAIHSGLSRNEINNALDNCTYGSVKFLFLSPERAETDIFLIRLQKMRVALVAVDEAHCISQWGYDFRPSYLNIAKIRMVVPDAPILALSASATDIVAKDIVKQLQFNKQRIIRGDFSRPNLSYVVRHDDNKELQINNVLRTVNGSGIIYARTRKECEEISQKLNRDGVSSTFYHAGLPYAERTIRQEEWIRNKCRVMVATNAFGMGIDKPDVRFVIHNSMCDSLESYYQEAGRAGRDGRRSYALLLVADSDERLIRRRVEMEFPPLEDIKSMYDSLCNFLAIPYQDGAFKSYKFNIYDYCRQRGVFSTTVRSALNILEMNGYLAYIEDAATPSRLIFRMSRDELYKINITDPTTEEVLNALMRLYSGLFSELQRIDEGEIASWCQCTFEKVCDSLNELSRLRVVYYISSSISPIVRLYKERARLNELYISPDSYLHRRQLCEDRVSKMIQYINNTQGCRSSLLEGYFGVAEPKPCGVCDICLQRRAQSASAQGLHDEILQLTRSGDWDLQQITNKLKYTSQQVSQAVEELISQGKLIYSPPFLRAK